MYMFKTMFVAFIASFLALASAHAETFKAFFPDIYAQVSGTYRSDIDTWDLRQGEVTLDGGVAQLSVPDGYYFLGAKDARFILETLWENPEDTTILGMIFPRDGTPFEGDSWGITLSFDNIGYVSDSDAEGYDYDDLLTSMQAGAEEDNDWRVKNGFGRMEILGWAATPHYDKVERKLYWAKKLHFEGEDTDTLNYNIRALGRRGVLIVNFIAGMKEMPQVEAAAPDVLKMISFTDGNRYADYVPGVDTAATIGIGGLIAGKLAAKAGLLVLLLAFMKKGFVLVLLPLIWIKNKFFGKKPES